MCETWVRRTCCSWSESRRSAPCASRLPSWPAQCQRSARPHLDCLQPNNIIWSPSLQFPYTQTTCIFVRRMFSGWWVSGQGKVGPITPTNTVSLNIIINECINWMKLLAVTHTILWSSTRLFTTHEHLFLWIFFSLSLSLSPAVCTARVTKTVGNRLHELTAVRSQPVYCAAVYRERRYQMLCEYNFSSWRWAC